MSRVVRFRRAGVRVLAGIAALALVALAPGCDWLKGSDMLRRSSPFLSSLSVSRSSVLCGTEFTVSFDYDDPQGDIYSVSLLLQHDGDSATRDLSTLWPDDISRSSGRAAFPVSFSCSDPGGRWTITVSAEDDLGHTSNILTGSIALSSAR